MHFTYTFENIHIPEGSDFDLTDGGRYLAQDVAYADLADLQANYIFAINGLVRSIGPDNNFEVYPGSTNTRVRFAYDFDATPVGILFNLTVHKLTGTGSSAFSRRSIQVV